MIELVTDEERLGARIKVIGVGGGGGNAVDTMVASGLRGVEFIVANTDAQALHHNLAPHKIVLGDKGLGAGANPVIGRESAEQAADVVRQHLEGADMVFITAGMGGGTGTGGAPVIGRIARELGCLTVGVVTRPFQFEGRRRSRQAEDGIHQLKENVDTLIVIPNQRLLAISSKTTSMKETFRMADDVLLQAVRGIADLVTVHGHINLDFADVRTIMENMGMAIMGCGVASGDNRAVEAAQRAISSPLLEDASIRGARGVLINITGNAALTLHEVNAAASLIQEQVDEEANIIFGAVFDETMGEEIRITVIATGFEHRAAAQPPRPVLVQQELEIPPPPSQLPPLRPPVAVTEPPRRGGGLFPPRPAAPLMESAQTAAALAPAVNGGASSANAVPAAGAPGPVPSVSAPRQGSALPAPNGNGHAATSPKGSLFRPQPQPTRLSIPAAAPGTPVRKVGKIESNERGEPYVRFEPPPEEIARLEPAFVLGEIDEDSYETPAILRRQAR